VGRREISFHDCADGEGESSLLLPKEEGGNDSYNTVLGTE